jgi:hypothetical protein
MNQKVALHTVCQQNTFFWDTEENHESPKYDQKL